MELANEYNLKSNLKSITNYNQTEVTIETNQLNCNNCWLIITDLTGKIIAQTQINKLENKASFSIEKIGNGVRLCNLVEDGKITNSIKFALFR